MSCPLDYSLCAQTVTAYRKEKENIRRQVLDGCYFSRREERTRQVSGVRQEQKFLLIVPGKTQAVFPGDRVLPGIGPQIAPEDWEQFIPVLVEGLVEVSWAEPKFWQGQLCHVEAGR